MFDTISGLPVHALVVHAVVVLLPLSSIGLVVMACSPRFDRRLGWLVLITSAVATGAAFVAMESGEELASRVGTPKDHYAAGRWLPWFALGQLVVTVLLWWLDRVRLGADGVARGTGRSLAEKALAVIAVAVAVATLGWTVKVGDSGARAVWGTTIDNTTPGTQPVP